MSVTEDIRGFFARQGIRLYGFADLRSLPAPERENFDCGIVFGMPYSRQAMADNLEGEPQCCYDEYHALNAALNDLSEDLARLLVGKGYKARAKEYWSVVPDRDWRTVLPHKTVATYAGLGWIGSCALLVTEEFGSAFRICVVLTDAGLECGEPATESRCPEGCTACKDACPGEAITGRRWAPGQDRAEIYDAHACSEAARARSARLIGKNETICALCMASCPFTRAALRY